MTCSSFLFQERVPKQHISCCLHVLSCVTATCTRRQYVLSCVTVTCTRRLYVMTCHCNLYAKVVRDDLCHCNLYAKALCVVLCHCNLYAKAVFVVLCHCNLYAKALFVVFSHSNLYAKAVSHGWESSCNSVPIRIAQQNYGFIIRFVITLNLWTQAWRKSTCWECLRIILARICKPNWRESKNWVLIKSHQQQIQKQY
jgi:hypothetical protein